MSRNLFLILVVAACGPEPANEDMDCEFTPEHCRSEGFADCGDCIVGWTIDSCPYGAYGFYNPTDSNNPGFESACEDGEDDMPYSCGWGDFLDAYLEGWVDGGCQPDSD